MDREEAGGVQGAGGHGDSGPRTSPGRDTLAFGAMLAGILLLMTFLLFLVWPGGAWGWVLAGAAVGWAVQMPVFAWIRFTDGRSGHFMAAWAMGMLVRFAAVGTAGAVMWVWDGGDPASFLLALVASLFTAKLLEPRFLPWIRIDHRGRSRA